MILWHFRSLVLGTVPNTVRLSGKTIYRGTLSWQRRNSLLMSETVDEGRKGYYEMATREKANGAIYDEVKESGERLLTFEKQKDEKNRQVSTETAHSPSKSEAVIVQRLLCLISAVVVFSVLTSASTLVLALTIMMSRNSLATDYTATVRGRLNQASTESAVSYHSLFLLW